jgi:glycosyltransferase involved in cell wall biosynthesis
MANLGKLPLVCTFHGLETSVIGKPSSIDGYVMRSVVKRASALTTVSDYLTEYLRAFIERKVITIHNGVNVNEIEALSKESCDCFCASLSHTCETKYIVFPGRFTRTKGQEQLVKALPAIKRQVHQAKILFIGGGSYSKRVQMLAQQLKINDDVIFAGYVPNQYPYIAMASVVVSHISSDRRQVFDKGMTQLEAISLSKPLVTRQGSEYERIFGNTIFYVNPSDIHDIADKIVAALTDERKSTAMADQSNKILRANLTWAKFAQRYAKLYSAILDNSKSVHMIAQ